MHWCRPATSASCTPAGGKAAFAPVFVFGMPQAGSALLGNLLSRHARVQHLGHLPVFSRLLSHALGRDSQAPFTARELATAATLDLEALGARSAPPPSPRAASRCWCARAADEPPAGRPHRTRPAGARMLHVRRDPRDTCCRCSRSPAATPACRRSRRRHWPTPACRWTG
jgi:hypothetical protein